MSTLRPLGSNVIVHAIRRPVEPGGKILIPEKARGDDFEYRVVAVGPLVRDLHPGQRVLTHAYSPRGSFVLDGRLLLVVAHSDILLAILPPASTTVNQQQKQ